MSAPLDRIDDLLDEHVRRVATRTTPIPTIAARAKAVQTDAPDLVRADIGQIVGVDPQTEVLYGPPVGLESLRAAIAELYTRSFSLDEALTGAHVTLCTGAAEALSLLFRCFAPGRRVGLPRGHWENYQNGVEMAGGETDVVDFFDPRGDLDIDGLRRAIRERGLAALVANFPCNPTGAVLSEAETRALAELAIAEDVILIADEVYARLRYDGAPPQTLLRYAPGHALSVGSASKEFLLPGARVGYVVSARADVTDRVLRKLVRANSGSPNVLGQERLLPLIEAELQDLRAGRTPRLNEAIRHAMKARRDALLEVLERHGMDSVGRAAHAPMGTIFLMARLPGWWREDDVTFVEAALDRRLASAIPGSAFGLPGSLRFSFGATDGDAIARLDRGLEAWRAEMA
ncbi:MAG: pyridoxal phosphate-dependent aminotransferase [Polyangiaceae bacterium]